MHHRRWIVTVLASLALSGILLHGQLPIPAAPHQTPAQPGHSVSHIPMPPAHITAAPVPTEPAPSEEPVPAAQALCPRACIAGTRPCGQCCGATCGRGLIDPKSAILKAVDAAIEQASLDEEELRKVSRTRVHIAVLLELARLQERHGRLAAADRYLRMILTIVGGGAIDPPPQD